MDGWIYLHKRILDWEWYSDTNVKILFIHLLLRANYLDSEWKGIIIKRGSLFTSVKTLSTELKLSEKQVRIALSKLIKTKETAIKTANNGTMITICKYEDYQVIEKQKGKRKVNNGATDNKDKEILPDGNMGDQPKTWRNNFEIYRTECKTEFSKFYNDDKFITQQEYYFPKADIKKLIDSEFDKYWGTDEGWEQKKKKVCEKIGWKRTIENCIKYNHQHYPKAYVKSN